ncbi:MAG TPA: AraC family transcriptional regulator, partial [Hydrogenophaga sp.]
MLLPDSLILDWAGPAEALRMTNQRLVEAGAPPAFELHFIGPQAQVASSVGATITDIAPLPPTLPANSWVVLLGQPGDTIEVSSA